MTNDQTVTQALLPCPFCGGEADIHHVPDGAHAQCFECEANSRIFDGARDGKGRNSEYAHEDAFTAWNTRTAHSGEAERWERIAAQRLVEISDKADEIARLSALVEAHSGEGRSKGAGEVDPSKMSVEMAELFGLVCKLERLKSQRDNLMRTDGGFAMIERAADMMDEIVDSVPELKAAFAKAHAREASYRAALSAPQGEVERLREALEKRTSMSTVAGGGKRPHVEIRFTSLADAHALTDAILNQSDKEDDHGSRP